MQIVSGYVEVHVFRKTETSIEYLLLKRSEQEKVYPGLWQMVTGKIKEGEKAHEAAIREMKEETGLIPLRFWVLPKVNQFYSAAMDNIYNVPVFAAEVSPEQKIIICDEHCEYKWADITEARDFLPWDEQRRAADILHSYLLSLPHFLDLVEIKHF